MQSITYILIVLFVLISGNNGDTLKFCNFIRDKSPDLVSTINCDEKIIEKKKVECINMKTNYRVAARNANN